MGKFSDVILAQHQKFIEEQYLFFVATAPLAVDGHINVSPKGLDAFKVISETEVAYMDLIGSGNETSAHITENERITFMFCSFTKVPNILRLYGKGRTILPGTDEWEKYATHFTIYESTRQIIVATIYKVQTSCGYGVPLYDYNGERSIHFDWAEKKGKDGLKEYIQEKNAKSLDDLKAPL